MLAHIFTTLIKVAVASLIVGISLLALELNVYEWKLP